VRTKGHKCITRTFELKENAKRWAQETERTQRRGEFFAAENNNKTLKEAYDAYNDEILNNNEALAYSSRSRLLWWVDKIGEAYLSTITIPRVIQLRKELLTGPTRKGKRSNATVNRYVTNLSALLSYAVEQGWLPRNPISGIKHLEESKTRDFALSEEKFAELLEACKVDDELYLLVLIAKETAARRGEILKLRREDINFEG
jgi:integrase